MNIIERPTLRQEIAERWLFQVSPIVATDYTADRFTTHLEVRSDDTMEFSICGSSPDGPDSFLCQMCHRVPFTPRSLALGCLVRAMFLESPQKEMIGCMDAGGVIASRAVMANLHSIGDGTNQNLPGVAMGVDCLASPTKDTVPAAFCFPRPYPAARFVGRLDDLFPKPGISELGRTHPTTANGAVETVCASSGGENGSAGRARNDLALPKEFKSTGLRAVDFLPRWWAEGRRATWAGILNGHRSLLLRCRCPGCDEQRRALS